MQENPSERAIDHEADPQPERVLNVIAPEPTRSGVYSDVASVSHDPDGVTIDFLFAEPGDATSALLQARVHMSHRMAIRLASTLTDNMRRWAPKEMNLRDAERELLRQLSEKVEG